MPEHNTTQLRNGPKWTPLVFTGLLLIFANAAMWYTRFIFNPQNFASVAAPAITSESSRLALADELTNRLLQDYPLLYRAIDDPTKKMFAGLLESVPAQNTINKAIIRLQTNVTAKNPGPIEIDLVPVKDRLNYLLAIANTISGQPVQPEFNINNIPDSIVLVEPSQLPNVYSLGTTLSWTGPLALVVAIFLLALALYRVRGNTRILGKTLLYEGLVIMAAALLSLLLGPIFKPPVLANVNNPNTRIVAENVYNAFVQTFNAQSWWIFGIGVLLSMIAGLLMYIYRPKPQR